MLPVITDFSPDALFARRGETPITQAQFLGQVRALAQRLPEGGHAINLCEDRLLFSVAFCAAMLRGQINLLPGNVTPGALTELMLSYPGAYLLSDKPSPIPDAPFRAVLFDPTAAPDPTGNVRIPADQIAAFAFTSGTTGEPRAHPKAFGTLVAAAELSRAMLAPHWAEAQIVATVPPQHMYGLEFSVFWPLVCGFVANAGKPFFPADLRDVLAATSKPRVLITTPVHLRACFDANLKFPELQMVISATAPLPREWAKRAESLFRTAIVEIYGCTEGGSLASRRTAETDIWTLHQGLSFTGDVVHAPHYPEPIEVQDELQAVTGSTFRLTGRRGDLIKVAGKRTSMAELTHKLLAIEGVVDGIVFMPEGAERPAAVAVAPLLTDKQILAQLAGVVDAVFLPRPIRCVPRLPRDPNGKIAHAQLLELLRA
jgi:acyl-coenzyme A synthetase/AMP-(fatty) acid ligase